jgi:hypothetical protein
MTSNIDQYLLKINSASDKKAESAYQKVADSFENELLEYDEFPSGYFEFIIKLMSDETFYSKPGLWNFLMVLSTEKSKMKSTHYLQLADTIIGNFYNYQDKDLCLAVCDFIARNYDEASARKLFKQLSDIEKDKGADYEGFVDQGLFILEREIARRDS